MQTSLLNWLDARTVNGTLHTYHSVLRILCEAFRIEPEGLAHNLEAALIADAHLMEVD
jgi:hypothetical protein